MATVHIIRIFLSCAFLLACSRAHAEYPGMEFTHLMGYTLQESTTLEMIRSKLGQTKLVEKGEAGEYEVSLCYKNPRTNSYVQFWSGEMGGPEHGLLGFSLSQDAPGVFCAALKPEDQQELLLLGRLRLGMTKEAYLEVVSKDSVSLDRKTLSAAYEYRRPITAEERTLESIPEDIEFYDGGINIAPQFDAGLLTSVRVWKVETN